ncbi:putative transporter small subunit [Paramicrobacterium chengjingii]|nr:putative transporter small subunit [Microbacterium chengjingii]
MNVILLTVYVLIWPLIVAGTLYYIASAFFREWREARREGRRLI